MYFQKMIIREGLLINVPKLITWAVCPVPRSALSIGICIKAPPPPLMVESVKAAAPNTNRPRSNQIEISATMVYIKKPALRRDLFNSLLIIYSESLTLVQDGSYQDSLIYLCWLQKLRCISSGPYSSALQFY